jgi:hypothetical protein
VFGQSRRHEHGCAIAQEVSRRLRPEFDARSEYVTFVVDKMTLRLGFLRKLRYPLPILISPTDPTYLNHITTTLCYLDTDSVEKKEMTKLRKLSEFVKLQRSGV